MKIRLTSIYSLLYNIVFLMVGIISVISVLQGLFIIDEPSYKMYLYLLVALFYVVSFIGHLNTLLVSPTAVKLICLYGVYFAFNSFLNFGGYATSFYAVLASCCWVSIFSLSYFYYTRNKFSQFIEVAIALLLCVLIISFFNPLTLYISGLDSSESGLMYSTPYYTLVFLPFVLLINNKIVSLLLKLGIVSCIIISGKRGGFIAYCFALLSYYLQFDANLSVQKKFIEWLKKAIIISCMILIILLLQDWLTPLDSFSVLQRLELFYTSDREELYEGVFIALQNNNLFEWVFGHGFRNTVQTIGNVAHNDFLEVLYDYGLIGLIIVVLLMVTLFRDYYKFKKMELPCTAAFLSSLIITFILMSVSEALIIPSYFLIIAMFWGRCYREYQNARLHK